VGLVRVAHGRAAARPDGRRERGERQDEGRGSILIMPSRCIFALFYFDLDSFTFTFFLLRALGSLDLEE